MEFNGDYIWFLGVLKLGIWPKLVSTGKIMINHGMLGQHFWDSGDLLGIDPSWGSTSFFFSRNFQVVLEIGDEGMAMLDLQGIQIIQYPRAQV